MFSEECRSSFSRSPLYGQIWGSIPLAED